MTQLGKTHQINKQRRWCNVSKIQHNRNEDVKENKTHNYNSRDNRSQTVIVVRPCYEDGRDTIAKESLEVHTTRVERIRKNERSSYRRGWVEGKEVFDKPTFYSQMYRRIE